MAAKERRQGLERVLGKLKASVENGDYYEAHQMYRTLYFRFLGQKKYDELLNLLYDGAVLFLKHKQHTSGSDLASLYVDVLTKSGTPVSDSYLDKLGGLHSLMEADSPERLSFLSAALRWSSQGGEGCQRGHPKLHQQIAITLWKEKNYVQSRYHFVHSMDGIGCASMLVEFHINKGYPSEVELFIAQVVFQYLCLKNKSTATVAFYAYTEKHPSVNKGPPFLLPLLNFLWFLLLAIESGKLAYFTVLCEQYQPSINRDPTYPEYLDKIGQIFFGLPPPPPKQRGLFGNLLNSLLDDWGEEDVSDQSALPSTSRTMQQEELD